MEQYPCREEDILAQFPNSRLHEIKYNRVCLSISQLKNIFKIFNKDFNEIFVDLCENQLEYKEGKSLDFYDVFNLIYTALDSIKSNKKINQEGFREIFVYSEEDERFSKGKESPKFKENSDFINQTFFANNLKKDEKSEEKMEIEELKKKINELGIRLSNVEKILKELKKI